MSYSSGQGAGYDANRVRRERSQSVTQRARTQGRTPLPNDGIVNNASTTRPIPIPAASLPSTMINERSASLNSYVLAGSTPINTRGQQTGYDLSPSPQYTVPLSQPLASTSPHAPLRPIAISPQSLPSAYASARPPMIPTSSGSSSIPRTVASSPMTTAGGGSAARTNEDGYKPRGRSFFDTPGRVFTTYWAEPAATNSAFSSSVGFGPAGKMILQKKRFFIVLNAQDTHCLCLSIGTHKGHGVAGRRDKNVHSIAYSSSVAPKPRHDEVPNVEEGEQGMLPYAIRVLPDEKRDALDPMSRIIYSKIYTIEYNIDVKPFGLVHDSSQARLASQFKAVHKTLGDRMTRRRMTPGRDASAQASLQPRLPASNAPSRASRSSNLTVTSATHELAKRILMKLVEELSLQQSDAKLVLETLLRNNFTVRRQDQATLEPIKEELLSLDFSAEDTMKIMECAIKESRAMEQ